MAVCIRCENLTKCYGSTVAVSGLSLEVHKGEIFGLLGPNGAGKSTTLYLLTGLVRPTSGSVRVFGKEIRRHFLDIAPRMGVVVERPAFYEHLSVRRNMLLSAKLAHHEATVDRTLDMVGLLHVSGRKAGALSGGLRQRLALAQAFLAEPELLVLDEPTRGLDPEMTVATVRLLRRLSAEAGATVVLSSHMINEVETLCDRVAVMNNGRLLACEATDVLLSYDQTRIEVLVDAPEAAANRLRNQPWIESVSVEPGRLFVHLRDGNAHVLNTFLVSAGYKVLGIIPRRRTLQEYFLKVLNP